MEVPLDDPGSVLPGVLANVKSLAAEGEDHVLPAVRADFLQSVLLVPLIGARLLDHHCPVFVGVVGNGEVEAALPVSEHHLELGVLDGEVLVCALVLFVDDELASVVLVLTDVEDLPCGERLQVVVFWWLALGVRGNTHTDKLYLP